jgi:NAD(P)-dependent dehydrogenase (short-subunit alcohol dehydrogenase family)
MLCARREEWLTSAVDAMRARGWRVEGRVCDVAQPQQVGAVVSAAMEAFGRVDILVNNAGVSWGANPEAMPLEKWRSVLDTNLTGAFLFAQAAGREMLQAKRGAIINIASVAGLRSSVHGPHYAGYTASKAGLMGLTRELAAAWGPQGIRVNAIAPGFFHSRLADAVIPHVEPMIKARNPIPRVGDAGELKGVALFLASDAAAYVTGQVLAVDGGMTIV